MLPFLCLLILCGLLTQNAQGDGYPIAIARLSPQMLHQLISQRMDRQALTNSLQNLPLQEVVRNGMEGGNRGGILSGLPLVGGLLHNVVDNILGIKILKVSLLDLDIKLDPTETRIIVTIPADIELEVKCQLGLLGRLLHVKLYLDIQVGVRLVKDPATGHITLTIENCQNNPGHLRITVLDNQNLVIRILNNIVRLLTNVLEKTLPNLLQKQLCPLVNGLVQNVLDLLQGSLSSQVHGEMFQLSPESFRLHDGSLNLVYQGQVQMPGGQTMMIPQDSAPISPMPLEGSLMNMVLSGNYLISALRALLPPQVFKLDSQSEGSVYRQQIAAVVPKASNFRVLQIASGEPSISLTAGKIQLWQPIEFRVYREHSTGGYEILFTIRANLVSFAHPSISGGKMIFTLHNSRIENVGLASSSVGNFDVQYLTGMITRLLSASLLPHQNKILAEGIPIPMLQNLGLNSVRIVVGKDAIVIFVPPGEASESAA